MTQPFRFGVATADHQCEAYDGHDDIRDVWERIRGLIPRGNATDFWNRYREDIDLAHALGCTAFRLSLSWARLEPEAGVWSEEAFAHYRDVLQCMRDSGMLTIATLVHNTWPLHIQAAGNGAGLLDSAFPDRMETYAKNVAQRLGDLIDYYVTLNEPNQLVYGWIKGFWMHTYAMPPGQPPDASSDQQMDDVLKLIPNLFRAHAQSREVITRLRPHALVGTNPLVLGLPLWLQRWVDRNATQLQSPEQAKRQATRLSQSSVCEGGKVDISIAQLTLTSEREGHAMFSEPYYTAHLCALHATSFALPANMQRWAGAVGVVSDMLPATMLGGFFPAARVRYYRQISDAVNALLAGEIEAVFDDDVALGGYANAALTLTQLPGRGQEFAVAMAFGSHSLLNAVDRTLREFKREQRSEFSPRMSHNTISASGTQSDSDQHVPQNLREHDKSVERIRKRGFLRVGIHPGAIGLCEEAAASQRTAARGYTGLEPEIARRIALNILGDEQKIEFVPLHGDMRMSATRSWISTVFTLRKSIAMFGTLLGTNWWNLGMAGKLPEFLCPRECVGTLDYVGLDYYWGVPSFWPRELHRLSAAAAFNYANAPVWPNAMEMILCEQAREFPGKPIIVIENGCVTNADGFSRAKYVEAHIDQVQRAIGHGAPVVAYLCWSITSNREWGLHFDANSDFGLYHIDLDTDPALTRIPTEASQTYAHMISKTAPPS